jgi:hypothetical protein
MGRLFEGFEILCTDYDHILEKRGIVFKGGHYIREDIIQGNTVRLKVSAYGSLNLSDIWRL